MFDTILYIDVLEHINDDKEELKIASKHLKPGGKLIIISPAIPQLYSEFDRSVGHYRRYTKKSIDIIAQSDLIVKRISYIDSLGALASLANRLFLNQKMPAVNQLKFWDKILIPCSKCVDRILGYSFGKSILAVFTKQD